MSEGHPDRLESALDGHHRVERLDPQLIESYRRMSPSDRIATSIAATRFVRQRLQTHLEGQPGWTPEEARAEVAKRFLRGLR